MIQNILEKLIEWVFLHGIKIVGILITTFLLTRLVKVFISKFLRGVVKKGVDHIKRADIGLEEKRLKTLEKVVFSIVEFAIWVVVLVTILSEFGINIGPLLAGIGVGALALGFGARSLVQDYILGLFILLEDQYKIRGTVDVGVKGKVKDFNLRRTVIGNENKVIIYMPNS